MLVKFAVTNYRGFSERIEWDLSRPSNYSFNEYAIKDGVIKTGLCMVLTVRESRIFHLHSLT